MHVESMLIKKPRQFQTLDARDLLPGDIFSVPYRPVILRFIVGIEYCKTSEHSVEPDMIVTFLANEKIRKRVFTQTCFFWVLRSE